MSHSMSITCDVCRTTTITEDPRSRSAREAGVGWVHITAETMVSHTPPPVELPVPRNLPQRSLKAIGGALGVPDETMAAAADEDVEAAAKYMAEFTAKHQPKPYMRRISAKLDVCPACATLNDENVAKIGEAVGKELAKRTLEPEPEFGDGVPGIMTELA